MIICVSEDRKSSETSLQLLLLSLSKHCPDLPVRLVYPPADDTFIDWLRSLPNVKLETGGWGGALSWNIKPRALLSCLEMGFDEVVWLDSDMIVTDDFRSHLGPLDRETIVLTEEALFGAYDDINAKRARMWGFEVGRSFPFVANSAVIRVTPSHVPLLQEWEKLLGGTVYQSAQHLPWHSRPIHLFGDQDVISALLTSTAFASVPVSFLKRGTDIIQYFGLSGYTTRERLANVFKGPPAFVHSQVFKPWVKFPRPGPAENPRDFVDTLYLDLSPYTLAARRYAPSVTGNLGWMKPQTSMGRLLRAAGFWFAPLVGLPVALAADFVRLTNLQFAKKLYFNNVSLREAGQVQEV